MESESKAYQLFDTQSPAIHGVDPRTGKFHTYVPIASLVGNEGRGPSLDLNLFYSPELYDANFKNWALRFTNLNFNFKDLESTSVYLANGEAWKIWGGKSTPPSFKLKGGPGTPIVVRKDGTTEILGTYKKYVPPKRDGDGHGLMIVCKIPEKIISASGLSLTIEWETQSENTQPRLKCIKDEKTTLLNVTYSDKLITFEVYPDSKDKYTYQFEIDRYETSVIAASNLDTLTKTSFQYNDTFDKLTSVEHSTGLKDEIIYIDDKASSHISSVNGTQVSESTYAYSTTPEEQITTVTNMIDGNPVTTAFHYTADGVQTKEVHTQGDCIHTVQTSSELVSKQLVSTAQHIYQQGDASRTEESKSTLDMFANLTSTTENGITTEWTYYRGAPKEEDTITAIRHTETDFDVTTPVGWIGDYFFLAGILNRILGKNGLTWGTVEEHTVTHDRWVTDTGKSTYNLPIPLLCPGDPNYFRTYVESEKVYTQRDGKRVDLQWTFYGYTDIPTKDSALAGPAVKPHIKLTILNPVSDDFIKLKSWQDRAMTLETTEYYNDINDPITFGRMKTLTQMILDSNGKDMPLSKQTTELQYQLENELLTITSTLTNAEQSPVVTSQTISALTGEVFSTVDSLGNKTSYQYDKSHRMTSHIEFDQSEELYSETRFSYESIDGLQCVTTEFPTGDLYREARDALGRIVKTKSYHALTSSWLTLSETTYDELGREKLTTEYDYNPDGTVLLNRQMQTSYDDWGQASKIQVIGGQSTHSEYDPISRQSSQWRQSGSDSSGTRVIISDDPNGGRKHEEQAFVNDRVTHSTTATYDAWGRVSEEVPSTGPSRQYAYDQYGRMTSMTCAGVVTRYTYPTHSPATTILSAELQAPEAYTFGSRKVDSLGRINETLVGGRQQTYTYAGNSPLGIGSLTASNLYQPTETTDFESSYDKQTSRDNEKAIGYPDKTPALTYSTYSLRGLLLDSQDAFGNTTHYQYDALGRLIGSSSDKVQSSFSYGDNGALNQEAITDTNSGSCMTIAYTYDEQLRESERCFSVEGFADLTIKRTYKDDWLASTEMLKDDEQLRLEQFTYTPQGQLESYQCTGSQLPIDPLGHSLVAQKFTYDALGNISQCISTWADGENTTNYEYDPTDRTQLKSVSHSAEEYPDTTFTYDEKGRLYEDSLGRSLAYDQGSRLSNLQTKKPYTFYEYLYDPLGRQTACFGTDYYEQYYYKGQYQYARKGEIKIDDKHYYRTSLLLNDSKACALQLQTLKQSGGEDEASVSSSFQIKDAHGSLVASYELSDNSQTFFAYTPFGYRPDDWTKSTWLGFNGQPLDRVTGTYPLGNGYRVYDPVNQRFQAPDSLSPFGSGGLNGYSYCGNNPISFSDPSGHSQVVHQYDVAYQPVLDSPVARAIVMGGIGIALAPFTGGASTAWTVAAVGLATASAGFGIASAALAESDPQLSRALGWASMGTGIASFGAGLFGARVAARSATLAASAERAGISGAGTAVAGGGRVVRMGGGHMQSLRQLDDELFTFVDTHKNLQRLNIGVHGKDLTLMEQAMNSSSTMVLHNAEHSASDLLAILNNRGIDPNAYGYVRLLMCYSGNGGPASFAAQFRQLINTPVKGYVGSVSVNYGASNLPRLFRNASAIGPEGEQALLDMFAKELEHKVYKINPYLENTHPQLYRDFRHDSIRFP